MTDLLEADDEAAALERLHELGCTDGLPVEKVAIEIVEALETGR